ncbi:hypothetical protein DMB66_24440 [Actinoplanes sp. ATCC 53533]|nr:hypothetical protein DMB66_24440 [Actinoplanes sp. ATCC 53533]
MVGVDGAGRTHRLRQLAAAATAPVWWLAGPSSGVTAGLAAARAENRLVIVDDAHRLDPAALRELAAAARDGVPMVISRRPTIDRPELSELDEAVAAGGVELLGPLDRDGVARLVATVTGRPVSPEDAAAVFEASAGLAAVATAVATAPPDAPAPALLARVQRRFAVLDRAVVAAARVLALRLDLADHVLAAAAGIELAGLAPALRSLRDEGLLVPDGERMIPAVAAAVLGELPAVERRRIHDAVAGSLIAAGTDPVAAAGQLRAARAGTPAAAAVYRAAGERLRFSDPAAAVSWFDDAADAGGHPATLAAGRAEAGALLGLAVDVDQFATGLPAGAAADADRIAIGHPAGTPADAGQFTTRHPADKPADADQFTTRHPADKPADADQFTTRHPAEIGHFTTKRPADTPADTDQFTTRHPAETGHFTTRHPADTPADTGHFTTGHPANAPADADRIALVAGAVAAHQGWAARAAELLLAAVAPGPVLAVPALIGVGRAKEARAAAGDPAPAALLRFAEGRWRPASPRPRCPC